jgi:hypothetical protein
MALVFLSCGQRDGEREIAQQLQRIIETEFEMECFNADSLQGFDDVMSITDRLSKADYYLFIDFKRDGDLPASVFTHQEFALARAWGITDMIAFQEEGLDSCGMLRYVLAHPIKFTRDKLLGMVRNEVRAKWNKNFSRNLVCSELRAPSILINYGDHTGTKRSLEHVWNIFVQNRRKDRAAFNTVAILYSITNESTRETIRPDSSYLKWAGQMGYQKSIFPEDEAHFDAFAIRVGEEGIFLHSAADVQRRPIITERGCYTMEYRVFSESFPPVGARIKVDYRGPIIVEQKIQLSETKAEILL